MEPEEERAFQQHASTISTYRSWDISAVICGLMINMAVFRYVPRDVSYSNGLNALLLQQAVQLILLAAKPETFYKIRLPLMVYNRGVRLYKTAVRFWPTTGSVFTDTFGYSTGKVIIASHGPGRAGTMIALFEPLLSVTHSMFHLLPFRLHIVYALLRVVLDISLVMPGMACLMMRPEIKHTYSWICNMVAGQGSTSAVQAPSGQPAVGMCTPEGPAWFIPAVLLFLIGHLLPLVLHYWLELRLKVQFLRGRVAQAAWHMPPQDVQQQEQEQEQPPGPAAAAAAAAAAAEAAWLDAELVHTASLARRKMLKMSMHGIALAVSYGYFVSTLAPQLTPVACGP